MNKLEVGMYVRTRYGYIARLKKINKTDRYTEYEFDNKIGYDYDGFFHSIVEDCIDDIEIIKVSHNIIDLIKVGDYVNGERVVYITNEENCWYLEGNKSELDLIAGRDVDGFEKPIKSIVTKEQFEQMKYEVE